MDRAHLRIYFGPEDEFAAQENFCDQEESVATAVKEPFPRRTVTLPLREVFPILSDAVHLQRSWLQEFDDDDITISEDLFEMIQAYQRFRRPSA